MITLKTAIVNVNQPQFPAKPKNGAKKTAAILYNIDTVGHEPVFGDI